MPYFKGFVKLGNYFIFGRVSKDVGFLDKKSPRLFFYEKTYKLKEEMTKECSKNAVFAPNNPLLHFLIIFTNGLALNTS
jgi:hypothetical protein